MTDYIKAFKNPSDIYHGEAVRLSYRLRDDTTIDGDGIMRWKSNNSVPPADCLALAVYIGLLIDEVNSGVVRDAEQRAFLAAYRANPPKLTEEDKFEMRAAFGKGATVVNVITGKKYRT